MEQKTPYFTSKKLLVKKVPKKTTKKVTRSK